MSALLRFIRFRNFSFWFWVLFTYVVAALIWWFISLEKQNIEMSGLKLEKADPHHPQYQLITQAIIREKQRNSTKYLSEGITFLLLIIIGAIIVYRSFRRQISLANMQRNFMMAVTHELKTPIATTLLSLETLKHRQLELAQQHKLIDNALSETGRLDILTNNILLASQLEEKDLIQHETIFSISESTAKTLQEYRHRFPARTISSNIEEGIEMTGDERMIQIAISNLLDNAIKYSPKTSPIELVLKKDKTNCMIRIIDKGAGIPDKEKKKIFQKFYRMGNENTRNTKGTGLGLFLTQKIIDKHKGHITVHDHPPTGSIFVIELPRHVS
ncbi:MAG: sensor histidine kinase [Bacteroidota bacterium]